MRNLREKFDVNWEFPAGLEAVHRLPEHQELRVLRPGKPLSALRRQF